MFRWPSRHAIDRSRRQRLVVTVSGTIAKYDPDEQDDSGALHQLLTIVVAELSAAGRQPALEAGQQVHVAIRYGDSEGLPEAIQGFYTGAAIELQGAFVPAAEAYEQEDGLRLAVIHFTHRPLGWVKFQGKLYR